MSALGIDGEGVRAPRREVRKRLLRYAMLLGVTLLCGAFYLAGIWTAAGRTTCVLTDPGVLVCGVAPPAAPSEKTDGEEV